MNESLRAQELHGQLLSLRKQRGGIDHATAVLLRQVRDEGLHRQLGYASIADYAEQALDLTLRQTRDLLQIGGMLAGLPALSDAFAEGRLSWTKARELIRVITPETEQAWVEAGIRHTSRTLEEMVAKSKLGEPPRAPDGDPRGAARRRLVFDMEAADAAVVKDAIVLVRTQMGAGAEDLNDGAILAAIVQRALHDAEEGTPVAERHRVVLTRCTDCGEIHAAEAEVSETVTHQADCDAEVVELRPGPDQGALSHHIPLTTRRIVMHRDGLRCVVPGCRCRLWLDVHHLQARSLGGGHEVENLATVCSTHHRLIHEGVLGLIRLPDGRFEVRLARGQPWVGEGPTWGSRSWRRVGEGGMAVGSLARPPTAP